MNESWKEFYRHLLLKQLDDSMLFLKNDPQYMTILLPLLKIPGDDPTKDSKVILFRWAVKCIINRLTESQERPDVPIDFSATHPALQNPNELSELVKNEPAQILDLVKHFSYEFFNTLRALHTRASLEFCENIYKAKEIPLHLVGKIISTFSISVMPLNFQDLLQFRVNDFNTLSELYEGLMCNFESHQIDSCEMLSTFIDPFMGDDAIVLVNQTSRFRSHFVDLGGNASARVFPSYAIINFLYQIENLNSAQILKQIQRLPDHPFTKKLKNQIILSQVLGLGNDWSPLSEKSIPLIITPECIAENVLPFPRDAEFISVSQETWLKDFDFLHAYSSMRSLLDRREVDDFPDFLCEDLFSILFLPRFLKKLSHKQLVSLLESLLAKIPEDNELRKYVNTALRKTQAAVLIFKDFKPRLLFYPYATYFKNCPPQNLVKLMNILEVYPSSAYSMIFHKSFFDHVSLQKEENDPKSLLLSRSYPKDMIDDYLVDKSKEISNTIPLEVRNHAIFDLAASYRQLSSCTKLVNDENLQKYIEKLFVKEPTYPDITDLTFLENPVNLKKKVTDFLSQNFDGFNGYLIKFSNYIKQLLFGSSKMLAETPHDFIFGRIQVNKTLQAALKTFEGTGIDLEAYIYNNIKPNDLSKQFLIDIVKNDPVSGLTYAYECLDPHDVVHIFSSKPMVKLLSRSKHFEAFSNDLDQSIKIFESTGDLFEVNGDVQLEEHLPKVFENLKQLPEEEACAVLSDLALQFDLDKYYMEVLEITKKFKNENRLPLYEHLLSIFPADSSANILFYKRFDKSRQGWQEMLDISYDSDAIFNNPAKVYTMATQHLKNYVVETQRVYNIKQFAQILIIIRAKKAFKSMEAEKEWLFKEISPETPTLPGIIESLNDRLIVKMIVSVAMKKDVNCVREIAETYDSSLIFEEIRPFVSKNVKLLKLLPDDEMKDNLILLILKSFSVDSLDSASKLLLAVMRLQRAIKPGYKSEPLGCALRSIAENGLFEKYQTQYSTDDITSLFTLAMKFDIFEASNYFKELNPDYDYSSINRLKTLLGISPSQDGEDTKMLFESPTLPFDLGFIIRSLPTNLSTASSLLKIETFGRTLKVWKRKPRQIEIKKPKYTDLLFLNISDLSNNVKMSKNKFDNISFGSINRMDFIEYKEKDINDAITETLATHNLSLLFDSALQNMDYDFLKKSLKIFDDHSCIYCLLVLSSWALERRCPLDFFAGENMMNKLELGEFVSSLKNALTQMTLLSSTVDSSVLLPPGTVARGDQKSLNDVNVILDYQNQVGKNVSLFSSADKGKACVALLKSNEYERAFAMIKALGVDTTDIMIEAAAHFGSVSNFELGNFLVNVVPRLDVDSANQLTEALASILVGNKFEDSFIGTIIAGIDQPRNAFRILKWFGLNETAAFVALQNGLKDEIEQCRKDIRMKKSAAVLRACACWVSRDMKSN